MSSKKSTFGKIIGFISLLVGAFLIYGSCTEIVDYGYHILGAIIFLILLGLILAFPFVGPLLGRIFVSVDQFGNTLALGNPDNTISARVGYFANHPERHLFRRLAWKKYWNFLQGFINLTFLPWDGPNHCYDAYLNSAGNEYPEIPGYEKLALFIITFFVGLSCVILLPVFHLIGWPYRYFIERRDKRLENVHKHLQGVERKLNGVLLELDRIPAVNAGIKKKSTDMLSKAKVVHVEIGKK